MPPDCAGAAAGGGGARAGGGAAGGGARAAVEAGRAGGAREEPPRERGISGEGNDKTKNRIWKRGGGDYESQVQQSRLRHGQNLRETLSRDKSSLNKS